MSSQKLNILLVDDDPYVEPLVRYKLRDWANVIATHDPERALRMIRTDEHAIDLILLDGAMFVAADVATLLTKAPRLVNYTGRAATNPNLVPPVIHKDDDAALIEVVLDVLTQKRTLTVPVMENTMERNFAGMLPIKTPLLDGIFFMLLTFYGIAPHAVWVVWEWLVGHEPGFRFLLTLGGLVGMIWRYRVAGWRALQRWRMKSPERMLVERKEWLAYQEWRQQQNKSSEE